MPERRNVYVGRCSLHCGNFLPHLQSVDGSRIRRDRCRGDVDVHAYLQSDGILSHPQPDGTFGGERDVVLGGVRIALEEEAMREGQHVFMGWFGLLLERPRSVRAGLEFVAPIISFFVKYSSNAHVVTRELSSVRSHQESRWRDHRLHRLVAARK